MALLSTWFTTIKNEKTRKNLWQLTEKEDQRTILSDIFHQTVRSHYDDLANISVDINELGYTRAAKILKERIPTSAQGQSGELGEILATIFTEEKLGFEVPVRRLRFKDGREMALRGDDFIGVYYRPRKDELYLLKGESKSYASLSRHVIRKARASLNRDKGRCTAISLLFIADQLLKGNSSQQVLGRRLRHEVVNKTLGSQYVYHAFFTLTGNDAGMMLTEDLSSTDRKRTQHVINIRIRDHQAFIQDTYKKVVRLGKK